MAGKPLGEGCKKRRRRGEVAGTRELQHLRRGFQHCRMFFDVTVTRREVRVGHPAILSCDMAAQMRVHFHEQWQAILSRRGTPTLQELFELLVEGIHGGIAQLTRRVGGGRRIVGVSAIAHRAELTARGSISGTHLVGR